MSEPSKRAIPKWSRGMTAYTPLTDAVRAALSDRLRAVRTMLPKRSEGGGLDARRVHQLRVSTRRAGAAVRAFAPCLPKRVRKELLKELKRARRAASAARRADVHSGWIESMLKEARPEHAPALAWLRERLEDERSESRRGLARLAERRERKRFGALRRATLRAVEDPAWTDGRAATLREGATQALARAIDAVRDCAAADLSSLDRLHALRIAVKRLRYAMEAFRPALPESAFGAAYAMIEEAQEALGALNDAHELAERAALAVDALAESEEGTTRVSMGAFAAHAAAERDRRASACRAWWRDAGMAGALDALERAAVSREEAPPTERPTTGGAPAAARPAPVAAARATNRHVNGAAHAAAGGARRLAAIDIGTNTIRLIIAEAEEDGSYRVLDDEKEIARLGQGLNEHGAMQAEQMERAATTITSMLRIAQGYGAREVRAVGTAVLRSASNREEFLSLVRERCGLEIEVIGSQEEARLAFESAANVFDIESLPTAVVDIGGGSTEVALTMGGVLERIYGIDIGAVRATEMFGGDDAAGARFEEMRAWVDERFAQEIGEPPFRPQMVIGAGGTFEALAKMDILRREPNAAHGGPAMIRGYDLDRKGVRRLLDWLRAMTPAERRRVPGLSPQRADIIVAGVTLVDRLMRALGVENLRVHDGGIRDGLLLRMVRGRTHADGPKPGDSRDPMRSVRQFAASCNFDRRHCDHVAGLALQLFDQLAARVPDRARRCFDDESRLLLHAAAALHDVGYHINYDKHHRHSYHLIMHSGLSGFSPRQIEVIACVARHHRGSKPKEDHAEFARLSESDKFLVRWLSALLRVADGLDRTHMQNVTALRVRIEPERVLLLLTAEQDPSVDIWGSERKAGLFADVFGPPIAFEWVGSGDDSAGAAPEPGARTTRA